MRYRCPYVTDPAPLRSRPVPRQWNPQLYPRPVEGAQELVIGEVERQGIGERRLAAREGNHLARTRVVAAWGAPGMTVRRERSERPWRGQAGA